MGTLIVVVYALCHSDVLVLMGDVDWKPDFFL